MRSLILTVGICILLTTSLVGNVGGVGMYVPGKEECKCSSLVTSGTVPDTMNKLQGGPCALWLCRLIDRVTGEIKTILNQFGVTTSPHVEDPLAKRLATAGKGKVSRPVKSRRVRRPPSAM